MTENIKVLMKCRLLAVWYCFVRGLDWSEGKAVYIMIIGVFQVKF